MMIKEIIIKNRSCDLQNYNGVTESLELRRSGEIKHNYYNHYGDKIVKTNSYLVSTEEMERFFEKAQDSVKIDSWDLDYRLKVQNCHEWNCEVKYDDNSVKKIIGNIDYPPKGREFISNILDLTSYKDDPWIF